MGQKLITNLNKKLSEKYDIQSIKSSVHYFILMGVSIYVFMDMETRITLFKSQVGSSMSEREYDQQQTYKEIMKQIGEYSGEGTPLGVTNTELPTYRYEADEDE